MVKRRVRGVAAVDERTGEILGAFVIESPRGTGGAWVKVFQNGMNNLLRLNPHLHGQSYRVLHWVEAKVEWGNRIPSPVETAQELGVRVENAHRAYRELLEAGFLIRRGKEYLLSPEVGWKGTEAALREEIERLHAKDMETYRVEERRPERYPELVEGLGEGKGLVIAEKGRGYKVLEL